MIEYYFNSINKHYSIEYAYEKEFLGTAGSIYLLREKLNETFFVSNCDILINDDYREVYKHHQENHYDITIVIAIKSYSIPYGTIELDRNGEYLLLKEKPDFTYMINTGMYVLEPKVVDELHPNEFMHITTLIDNCKAKGMKVGIFPISEGSWIDMGQWSEYYDAVTKNA
jgi:NDP-sugar pyrophosphorylase family protein